LRWIEVCVETDGEAAEAAAALLGQWGQGGAVIDVPVDCLEPDLPAKLPSLVRVKAYLPAGPDGQQARRKIEEGLWHLGQIYPVGEATFRDVEEADWAEAWKKHFGLLRVSSSLVIVPAWQAYEARGDEAIIRLEPGMAFGTGLHPTTQLCLKAVERYVPLDGTVLDVGTGTGILSIGAAKLGAGHVLALDVDLAAVQAARDNMEANGVAEWVEVRLASVIPSASLPARLAGLNRVEHTVVDDGLFDLVLANILAPVIIAMAPVLTARLARCGTLVVAGLVDTQEEDVLAALREQGLSLVERWQEQDWVVLALQHAA
jgi:ribosomal protein L11 methyltransferase